MSDDLDRDEPQRPPPPWGEEITPLTEVCGGQYVLLHELARGDLSIVYRAKPTGSRDAIAFKVIQDRYVGDEAQVRRFRREAEVLRRIEHPNIVRLVDDGTIEDGRAFAALELLVGQTLSEALSEAERMSPERTCRIARQIGRALRAMHRSGVIHRDLQPENILLIGSGDAERVKLVDFSEAGDVGAPARRVRADRHSSDPHDLPSYRPPEQVRKRPPQPTMDVFALGVIMFEMLAGEHPFAVAKTKAGPTIRSKAFDAPEVLLMLVADCIDKDARERPRSIDEVLERIDKALLWMGVVPQELTGTPVNEEERTQPYTVADPGSPEEEQRLREVAEAAETAAKAKAEEAKAEEAKAEEAKAARDARDAEAAEAKAAESKAAKAKAKAAKAKAAKAKAGKIEPEAPRRGAVVAGEMYASSGSFRVDDAVQAPYRRGRRAVDRDGVDDSLDGQPIPRRRPGSERPKDPARWDERGAADTQDDASLDEGRRGRAGDTRDESWDDSRAGRSRGRRDESREDSRRGRSPRDSRDESWDDSRRGRSSGDSRDESWDDSRRGRSSGDSRDESWDDPSDSQEGSSSGSSPQIDVDELREKGAPSSPRFVVDTVAWTKQQPSAKPEPSRPAARNQKGRRKTGTDMRPKVRVKGESESSRPAAGNQKGRRKTGTDMRRPRDEPEPSRRQGRAKGEPTSGRNPSSRGRSPTSAQARIDPSGALPRWTLPLLVMVIVALAYAVWLVWTR